MLWELFKAGLLVTNSLAILHEKRFLRQYGLDRQDGLAGDQSLKNQAVGLLNAVQYMRVPLVVLNSLTAAVELLMG